MYRDDELLPLSGLQHLAFCPRQCVLIHVDQVWAENRLTALGRVLHERVHEADSETRGDVRIARGVKLLSRRLGLTGVADVVECRRDAAGTAILAGLDGSWLVRPVEYKRGRPKTGNCDAVQVCAQAMCLEEMLNVEISAGDLFYGQTRRRSPVVFDRALREETAELARRFHELVRSGELPAAERKPKCDSCSLQQDCLPGIAESASSYLRRMIGGGNGGDG